ncbi:hypothetical protein NDA16_003800 [Ustilago loliicola]|nr:hypothetical protein NDA16_003800 [Ustilago loliicola]
MELFTPAMARLLAVAIVIMTAQVTSLPTYGFLRHPHKAVNIHRRSPRDDHGNVSAHDGYEAQLHNFEAALQHYEEYGDAKSLETYLKGFTGDNADNASNDQGSGDTGSAAQGDNDDKHDEKQQQKSGDDCEEGHQYQHPSNDSSSQQQQPKMVKKPKNTQPKPSQDYTQPQQQPKSQPQPEQPKPQPSQPQTPPESYDPTPSKDHYNSHNDNKDNSKPSPPSSSDSSSDPHSIDGYTCPKFDAPSSAPSTKSLYTSPHPFTGRATYYNTSLGACGIVNSDTDPIVAISADLFEQYNPSDANPNHNSLCGRKVEITWKGKTVHAFATDECPSCKRTSLDMSPKVFESLDDKDKGVLDGIQWRFI